MPKKKYQVDKLELEKVLMGSVDDLESSSNVSINCNVSS